jgi:putative flavoprotein involved in K+ transport
MRPQRIHTVIIGGGQAGLAMSRCLTDRGIEHVVLERGRIGERWRSERWDSLRLLTPAWHTRLPGHVPGGTDPGAFLGKDQLVDLLCGYARSFAAPVIDDVMVTAVRPTDTPSGATARWGEAGLVVETTRGTWWADEVVVATGHCATVTVPPVAGDLPADVAQVPSTGYRNPALLPEGAVLVVGSGPSGQQIAAELADAGRRVILAVGRHVRLPRRYRDRDVIWWGDATGQYDQTVDDISDVAAARRAPSLALWGGGHLDLGELRARGVTLTGRLEGVADGVARFDGDSLANAVTAAEDRMDRYLDGIDRFAAREGLGDGAPAPRPVPADWHRAEVDQLDLRREGVGAVVWATGFRPDFSFVHAPVFDSAGEPLHRRGITAQRGLSFLGLRWQYRRKSSFIDGVGDDARYLAAVLDARRRGHVIGNAEPALVA